MFGTYVWNKYIVSFKGLDCLTYKHSMYDKGNGIFVPSCTRVRRCHLASDASNVLNVSVAWLVC